MLELLSYSGIEKVYLGPKRDIGAWFDVLGACKASYASMVRVDMVATPCGQLADTVRLALPSIRTDLYSAVNL